MDNKTASLLMERYLAGETSEEESRLVQEFYEKLLENSDWDWKHDQKELIEQRIEKALMNQIVTTNKPASKIVLVKWWRRMAAACIIAIVGAGIWQLNKPDEDVAVIPINAKIEDVNSPQFSKATLTLDDGTLISLDSLSGQNEQTLAGLGIEKNEDGSLKYRPVAATEGSIKWNQINNPRGSKVVHLTLTDGSKVWLNAGSSLRYPMAFVNGERKVELQGEGYFEVASNPNKKFIVLSKKSVTEVLGTHFNINAYPQSEKELITLFEGSVLTRETGTGWQHILKPGEQAVYALNGNKVQKPDLESVLAWKNEVFNFEGVSFTEAMHQLENWYNIDVVYEGKVPEMNFFGKLNRNTSLKGILNVLQSQGVRFSFEGKKLTVY